MLQALRYLNPALSITENVQNNIWYEISARPLRKYWFLTDPGVLLFCCVSHTNFNLACSILNARGLTSMQPTCTTKNDSNEMHLMAEMTVNVWKCFDLWVCPVLCYLNQGGPSLREQRASTIRYEEKFAGRKERNSNAIKRLVCCSNSPNSCCTPEAIFDFRVIFKFSVCLFATQNRDFLLEKRYTTQHQNRKSTFLVSFIKSMSALTLEALKKSLPTRTSAVIFDLSFVKPFTNVFLQFTSNVALKQTSQWYLRVFARWKISPRRKINC